LPAEGCECRGFVASQVSLGVGYDPNKIAIHVRHSPKRSGVVRLRVPVLPIFGGADASPERVGWPFEVKLGREVHGLVERLDRAFIRRPVRSLGAAPDLPRREVLGGVIPGPFSVAVHLGEHAPTRRRRRGWSIVVHPPRIFRWHVASTGLIFLKGDGVLVLSFPGTAMMP